MPYLLKVKIKKESNLKVWYKKGEEHLVLPNQNGLCLA